MSIISVILGLQVKGAKLTAGEFCELLNCLAHVTIIDDNIGLWTAQMTVVSTLFRRSKFC